MNQTNVIENLTLAWAFQAKSVPIKSTPLMVDGILGISRSRITFMQWMRDGQADLALHVQA